MTPDTNVIRLLQAVAAGNPDRLALVEPGPDPDTCLFGYLWRRVDAVSAGLRRIGLKPGDRLIVMIPMSVELYVVLLAIWKIGAAAVFVDPWMPAGRIARFCTFADPAGFIGVPRSHLLRMTQPALRRLRLSISTGPTFAGLLASHSLVRLARESGDGRIHPVTPDDPALITFTSGSSGEPKGANRTHGFLMAQHKALAAAFPAEAGDVQMTMFPVFALSFLARGLTTVIPEMDFKRVGELEAKPVLDQIWRHKVSACTASPPFFDRLADWMEGRPGERLPLRHILTGGAPVTDRQLRRWKSAFPETPITIAYGSTEAEPVSHIGADARLALPPQKQGGFCMGVPVAGIQSRLLPLRPSLPPPKPGDIGELAVCGDHVCRDYFRNTAATVENKIRDSEGRTWHRMGDTGYFDAGGRFWLVGRVHSTLFRDGRALHPQLIEQSLDDPSVLQAAAVGLPDPGRGQRLVVVVRPRDPGVPVNFIWDRLLAAGHVADAIAVSREALPTDPRHNAKIDYESLRRRLVERKETFQWNVR